MFNWKLITGLATLYRLIKEILQDSHFHHFQAQESPSAPITETREDCPSIIEERYQVTLGRRHKFLREEVLDLNAREMSDFYGFEKVSFLEDCESGLDEFPTDSIGRLVSYFFIEPKYIQEGKYNIFQKFEIISSRKDCKRFLEEGFSPTFLCDPDFQNTGFVYLTFNKKDQGIWRSISSNTVGNFHSSGSGANNIYNFIYAILDLNYGKYISFVDVSKNEWDKLRNGSWYKKGRFGYGGMANHQASDMFDAWVDIARKSRGKIIY